MSEHEFSEPYLNRIEDSVFIQENVGQRKLVNAIRLLD